MGFFRKIIFWGIVILIGYLIYTYVDWMGILGKIFLG
jgi:hypothetical protein